MNQHLLKKLSKFGLSEKEAQIYLSLLELEAATVFELAKVSGVNRSSAYVVLDNLIEKGLVGISEDKRVRRYVAASPEILVQNARAEAKRQEDIKLGVESVLPELKALHKATKRRPVVKVFEGDNGVREVYVDLFSTQAKELRVYDNPAATFERTPDFIKWFDKERSRRKIKLLMINPATPEVLNIQSFGAPGKPYELMLIPPSKYNFSSDLAIYADRVAIASPKDNFGIIIENKEIADMLKNNFDLAWEEAKRLSKKIRRPKS